MFKIVGASVVASISTINSPFGVSVYVALAWSVPG